ncbi:substrate-binding domain-containing protein [Pseudonocardia sp. MCCB 268]|nr:substrate-binding domain-containing protein [Pseudonocardia cytotoxica]
MDAVYQAECRQLRRLTSVGEDIALPGRAAPVPTVVYCDQPADVGRRVRIGQRAGTLALGRHMVGARPPGGSACSACGRARRHDSPASRPARRAAPAAMQREQLAGLRGVHRRPVDWSTVPVVEQFEHTPEAGADGAAAPLLGGAPGITALICTSDISPSARARSAPARAAGAEDLSVARFDGVPRSQTGRAATVRQPFREKSREAGRLLLERSDGSPGARHPPTELVIGTTTRALRQSSSSPALVGAPARSGFTVEPR